MVFVHPGGFPVKHYQSLAMALEGWGFDLVEIPLCPAYWKVAPEHGGKDSRALEIIQHIILTVQDAHGTARPLILGGWSMGGVFSHALASHWPNPSQIRRLVMVDSIAPTLTSRASPSAQVTSRRMVLGWFVDYFNALKQCQLSLPWFSRWISEEKLTQTLYQQAKDQGALDKSSSIHGFMKVLSSYTEGLSYNAVLTAGLPVKKYQGDVRLIKARHGLLNRWRHQDLGWRELSPDISIDTVECNHYSLLSETRPRMTLARHISGR